MFEKYLPDGNDRAVSPVIGVVLMVGIVVALGAVVGGAVLGLGVGVGETAPNAQFDATTDSNGNLTSFEHVAGDTVSVDRLSINGDAVTTNFDASSGEELTAGSTVSISDPSTNPYTSGEYNLQWTAENGETSAVIATFEA